MSSILESAPGTAALDFEKPISIVVLAMGWQGGGVLTDWIVAAAEHAAWTTQSTSVPRVAKRTGATIYYVEMFPALNGRLPVLSLMPTPGRRGYRTAAEFMEAGRSMLRGFVTPDRTTLIASTRRTLAVSEKERPGDGIARSLPVVDAIGIAAKHAVRSTCRRSRSRTAVSFPQPYLERLRAPVCCPSLPKISRPQSEPAEKAWNPAYVPSRRPVTAPSIPTLPWAKRR